MSDCKVHIYAWSQQRRRKMLRRFLKEGIVSLEFKTKSHFHYKILDMTRYSECKKDFK